MAIAFDRIKVTPVIDSVRSETVSLTEIKTLWVDVCTAPEATDNATNVVINPGAITRADQTVLAVKGKATKMRIRLKYDDGLSGITDPVVQPFGFDKIVPAGAGVGELGLPERLADADGDHEQTLATAVTDCTDGTYKYTDSVEVLLGGNEGVMVAIKTALAGTGTVDNSAIQVRFL